MNMARVENLIQIFDDLRSDNAKSQDILRAAVVLLHASLEDALRQLLLYRMPKAPQDLLTRFFSDRRDPKNPKPEKMNIGDLSKFHKMSVEKEIARLMKEKLEHSNYNHTRDVVDTLVTLGFKEETVKKLFGQVEAMMLRRHQIVHRSDRKEAAMGEDGKKGSHGTPRSIDKSTVDGWLADVRKLLDYVIERIDDPNQRLEMQKAKARIRTLKSK
jgi:hypothetical protein